MSHTAVRARFDRFTIDSDSRRLTSAGADVHLSPKAFDLLCLLIAARPAALAKDDLHARIWPGVFVVDANLSVLIAEIRRALGDDAHAPRFIRTVHRHGYAFSGEVAELKTDAATAAGATRRAWLVWQERVLLLAEGGNFVGRDPACGVWLDVPGVSRRHARIEVSADAVTIEDLGSVNGTFVNGTAVNAVQPLQDGDRIQVGPVDVQFRLWSDADEKGTVRISRERNDL